MHTAEAAAELSAVEEVAEFAHHEARQRVARLVVGCAGEEGGEVLGEDLVQSGGLGLPTARRAGESSHIAEWQRSGEWLHTGLPWLDEVNTW